MHDQPLSGNGNHRTGAKRFGRGRIAGLILIALLTLGLGYLHFAGGSTSVSVPAGAHAGQLTLKHCTYGNEPADCGTLVVPENRHDPHSRLIALPITRIRAHTPHPGAPIFRLQGGPGLTNMDFPDAKRFTAHHDFVLVGYRGVDGSSRLDCPEVVASIETFARPAQQGVARIQTPPPTVPAPSGSKTKASISPGTRCPSASTTSNSHATDSATDRSTSSARVPARARR